MSIATFTLTVLPQGTMSDDFPEKPSGRKEHSNPMHTETRKCSKRLTGLTFTLTMALMLSSTTALAIGNFKPTKQELRLLPAYCGPRAEPWGNGYDPNGFSDMGWASFNDQFRDGLKGSTFDIYDKGFLLGQFRNGDNQKFLQRLVMGSPREFGGQYVDPSHSVNYLESHDDYTFGDRLRITGGFVDKDSKIIDHKQNALVGGTLLAMNKLGALFLFTSQGITFMHEGQEWARSKVIAETTVPDKHIGMIDHNSYEKDNETNWLNWDEREMNTELVDYYKGLIALRKQYSEFRRSKPEDFEFMDMAQSPVIKISGYQILQTARGVVIMSRLFPDIRMQEPHRKTLRLVFIEL